MEDEKLLDEVDKPEETPEQKASKIDKQYANEMAFIAKVLGSDTAINPSKALEGDAVANVVARVFKERDEKLADEVFKGLNELVELHLKNEAALRDDENKLKAKRTQLRKDFIKVAKAWKGKINQQTVAKEDYVTTLKKAIEESKEEEK